ncbi:MAG: glycosyltransferase family 87 protein [Phenylobacterium sp.]
MVALQSEAADKPVGRTLLLATVVAALAFASYAVVQLFRPQAAGADFSCFWAGAKTIAAHGAARLYDFRYITELQGWPLGPASLRPFIYPPSAIFVFLPLAIPPYWAAYALWVIATGGLFLWAGRKAGAPWWFMLTPPVVLVMYCGQVTMLIGGLAVGGLALQSRRPVLAGVLLGAAAAVKPQLLMLVPIGLAAAGSWRTVAAAGATGALLVSASVMAWGIDPWFGWLAALPRFQAIIFSGPRIVADLISPYSVLFAHGMSGAWAFLLAPFAVWLSWSTFRRTADVADRSMAVFAGALLVAPYAMNYEAALFAPAAAAYLARTDEPRWLATVVAGVVCLCALPHYSVIAILAALALLALRAWPGARAPLPA